MKKLFTGALLILVFFLKSQVQLTGITEDTITVNLKNGVKEYYENVYKAQDEIVKNNLDKAINYYFKAFSNKMPFYKDLRNLELAIFNNGVDSSAFAEFFMLKYKHGGGRHNSKDFYNLYLDYEKYDTLNYYKNLSSILDTVKIDVLYDSALEKQLLDIFNKDQSIRDAYASENGNPEYMQKLRKVDSLNLDEVLQLYKNNQITFTTCGNGMNAVDIVLTHSINKLDLFLPTILNEVYSGNFDARLFAEIIDNYKYLEDSYYGIHLGEIMFNKYIVKIPSKERLNEINERRNLIFLDSILNVEKQTIFTIQSDLDWNFYIYKTNYVCGEAFYIQPNERDEFIKENYKKYIELQEKEIQKIKDRGFEIIEYDIY